MDLNWLVAALTWGGGALGVAGCFCLRSYLREPPYETDAAGRIRGRPHPGTALGSTICSLRSRRGPLADDPSKRPTLFGVR